MDISLETKNALICGSSKGIGKAIAFELALLGANITLAARSADMLEEVKDQLDTSIGQYHQFFVVDFNDSKDLRKKVNDLVAAQTIHILVNNTGGPKSGMIIEASTEEFEQAFHNHLVCNQILAQAVVNGMKREGYGRIINIISTSVKQPLLRLGVSNTIRGAVATWAKTLANELGVFGITVNNILPGATYTSRLEEIIASRAAIKNVSTDDIAKDMRADIPVRRFAKPEEIAFAAAFLASPSAAYITGINLPVDGGRTKSL